MTYSYGQQNTITCKKHKNFEILRKINDEKKLQNQALTGKSNANLMGSVGKTLLDALKVIEMLIIRSQSSS